jgi:2-polyprenyl-3-methyl-5-hydroxy-6-metoxy-1,4-benzoquinol methylase
MINYTEFNSKCGEIESKFGGVRGLRLDNLDTSPIRSENLLDFGCGKGLNSHLAKNYYTFDNDQSLSADFSSFDEIPEDLKFNAIVANQVFEHIDKRDIFECVKNLSSLLVKGGKILATIPNVCNWFNYVSDFDHRNPLTFYHLGAIFEVNEIKVIDSYRWTKDPISILNASETDQYLLNFMRKYFEIDPAKFICVVGEKK